MKLEHKVAIVTGAGSGIGWAIAERLADEGAAIVVADVDPRGSQTITERLNGNGSTATFVRTDVALEEDIKAVIATAVATYGHLDILINNAGINWSKPLLETT